MALHSIFRRLRDVPPVEVAALVVAALAALAALADFVGWLSVP